jgi:BMFP domain-containing protein YqiC
LSDHAYFNERMQDCRGFTDEWEKVLEILPTKYFVFEENIERQFKKLAQIKLSDEIIKLSISP